MSAPSAVASTRASAIRASAIRWHPGDPEDALAAVLARGGVVALPTESSYSLAARPNSRVGVERVYRIKARAADKPLPVMAARARDLAALGVDLKDPGIVRARRLWPAALTVVAALEPAAPSLPAAAGGRTLAVRIPGHRVLRGLLRRLGPLCATSANRSGEPAITDPAQLDRLLEGHDAIIADSGTLPGGLPSTIVRWRRCGFDILRHGAFDLEERLSAS